MPQGTKLGPWLFLILINDLNLATPCSDHNAPRIWKYVDDTTASEVVIKGRESKAQQIADQVVHWSSENKMKLNSDKCKELRISFARNQTEFSPVIVNGKGLEVVQHAKLLGVTISSDLSWNEHIRNVVKKASKRLYFLVQLKRAKVAFEDLVLFYVACIRSILTYATPVFYYALPIYLQQELECVQKRAISIISSGQDYHEILEAAGIPPIMAYIEDSCSNLFSNIIENDNHRLRELLPGANHPKYNLRRNRRFEIPRWRTNCFKNTFMMASTIKYNNSSLTTVS